MSLFNKKEENKSKREVGEGLNKEELDKIFDALDNRDESKKVNKELKKHAGHVRESSELIDEAIKEEMSGHTDKAIKLYEKILIINPHESQAYERLAEIYSNENDFENEVEILKSAIKNTNGNDKNKFMLKLKELKK